MTEEGCRENLSIEECCVHKAWKVRLTGYTKLLDFLKDNEDEQVFLHYQSLITKMLSDNNAIAQEKGVETVVKLLQCSKYSPSNLKEILEIIITKCIGASRMKTREASIQIILLLVEHNEGCLVEDELIKGMGVKNPKIVSACLSIFKQVLIAFGPAELNTKYLLKLLPNVLEDRDKTIREEGKMLLVEIYRWHGDVIKPNLNNFKPSHINELQSDFERVKHDKPSPTRFCLHQPDKKTSNSSDAVTTSLIEKHDLEPVRILNKLDPEFFKLMDSKKWQERKEALDKLDKLLNYNKLDKGDYNDLIRCLDRTITTDSNVVVVGVAIKCLAKLGTGLKKQFTPFAPILLPHLLEKFKEKKLNVLEPLREAVDSLFLVLTFENMKDDLINSLESKNPTVKSETALYISRCFSKSTADALSKKILKALIQALVKTLNEPDPNVRDSSAEALGTAMKIVGEKEIMLYLTKVDAFRLCKIREYCDKAVLNPITRSRPASARESVIKVYNAKQSEAPKSREKIIREVSRKSTSVNCVPELVKGNEICKIDFTTKMTQQLLHDLDDKNWSVRMDALNSLTELIKQVKQIKSNLGELPSVLLPRLTDSNVKIIVCALDLCRHLAVAMGCGCKIHFKIFIRGFLSAFSNNKIVVRTAAVTTMATWGELAGYKDLFDGDLLQDSIRSGTPFLKIELYTLLSKILPTLQPNSFSKDDLIAALPYIYLNLEDRNLEVRKAATNVLSAVILHVNYTVMLKQVDEIKPTSRRTVLSVLSKWKTDGTQGNVDETETNINPKSNNVKSRPRSRSRTPVKVRSEEKPETSPNTPLLNVNDLKQQRQSNEQKLKTLKWNFVTPQPEYVEQLRDQMKTAKINNTLISNMFHSDFKFHIKALESLQEVKYSEAIISNLDLLLKWFTLRFFDTNPTVLIKCLEYCHDVFDVLIKSQSTLSDYEVNSFVPYLILKLGDPKDLVRERVLNILNQITSLYQPNKLFGLVLDGVKSKNSRQRCECLEYLGCLVDMFGNTVYQPQNVKEMAKNISDRDGTVRGSSLGVLVRIWQIEGNKIYKMIGKLPAKEMGLLEERLKRTPKPVADVETLRDPEVIPLPCNVDVLLDDEDKAELKPSSTQQLSLKSFDLVDIDDSFLKEPIDIPECLSKKMPQVNTKPGGAALLTHLMHSLCSSNINTAFKAGFNLRLFIEGCDDDGVIVQHTNDILESIIIQLKFVNMYSFEEYGLIVPQTYRVLLRLIDDIFVKRIAMAQAVSVKNLQSLLNELIYASVENTTGHYVDGGYNKIINIYLSRIIENSDFNKVTVSCLKLLVSVAVNPVSKSKTVEMCSKCLIKTTHVLKTNLSTLESCINLDVIMYECYLFFKVLPYHSWKERSNNLPLRALKTFLITILHWKKNEIFSHMSLIDSPTSTDLCFYLKRLLRTEGRTGNKTKITQAMSEHLSQVFMKIASEATAKEGLAQFLEFKKQHPHVDLSPYLAPTSQYFRDYVENGMKEIEEEMASKNERLENGGSASSDTFGASSDSGDHVAQYYLDKLKEFHEKVGYPPPECPDFINK